MNAAIIRRRAGRWALNGAASLALLYILTPLIFVVWLAFFRQEIPSFPPEGYSLKWFAAILDQRKFVDGFTLSLQVGVLATLIGLALGVPAALCVVRFQFGFRAPLASLLLMPLIVLDVHEKVARNPDYILSLDDVRAWERRHGRIPAHAFVAMRTDWSKRWPNDASMQNKDAQGVAHYPGWSMAVLKLLYEDRHIAASGHETTDTDPGVATTKDDYSLESYVLGTNHYQVEMLASLDQVPEFGALVMVGFPKPANGSGFPARVIAIVP